MDDGDDTLKERRNSLEEPTSPVETSRPKGKTDLETKFNTVSFRGERGTRGEKALRRKKRKSIINNHIYDLDVSVYLYAINILAVKCPFKYFPFWIHYNTCTQYKINPYFRLAYLPLLMELLQVFE